MRKIAPGFVLIGSALLIIALLLLVYFITYRPTQQHPEFEAQIDNPASVPISANDQSTVRVQTLKVDQSHGAPKRQFQHAVENKPGFFKRLLNFIKRLFGGGKKKGGSYALPFVRGVQASTSSVVRPCRDSVSMSCKTSESEVVQVAAVVSEADRNRLRYEWSATAGKITDKGFSATWDLSGVNPGTYIASVSVYDGNDRINGQASVTVADCTDCIAPPPPCPSFSVSSPEHVRQGEPITFVASGATAVPGITYNWTVSSGKIVSGSGTSAIMVDSAGSESITATVSLGGMPPECGDAKASSTTGVQFQAGLHRAVRFFSYQVGSFNDEKPALDGFTDRLMKDPTVRGTIVAYGSCAVAAQSIAARSKNYLVASRGLDSSRIEIIDGGCRGSEFVELWLVPKGAVMPSVDPSPCECDRMGSPDNDRPRGRLSGRVTDKNGVALPDATVTLIGTKFRTTVKSDGNGVFEFKDVPPGRYTLEITAAGLGTRRVEDLEVKEGVNLLPEAIQVFEKDITTRFKLRDVIRIGYPDHFLESPAGEITFDWNRELRETEVVSSQTKTDGRISIIDRPPPVPGGTPEVPVVAAHGQQYTAFAKVTLIADGLTVVSSPSSAEQSLAPAHVSWSWKVKPADMNAAIASFRFHIDLVWRGEGLKEQTDSYDWPTTFVAKIGPPSSVKAAKYGSPAFAFMGLITVGFGLRKRKLLAALPGEIDQVPAVAAAADAPQAEVAEDVSSSVFAPRRAACGEGFLVQIFAHLPGEDPLALKGRATEAEPRAERVGGDLLDQQIKRGTTLTFTLSMKGLEIDQPQQDRVWRGRTIGVQFGVTVPKDFKPGSMYGLLVVSADTIPIGHFRFAFEVVEPGGSREETPDYVGALTRYQHAFISYAHQDRAEVLKRVQMLNLLKEKFFQDFITLEPGNAWEPAIHEAIDRSDVIFLFWSKAASASTEVRKEILYAMARRKGDENAAPAIHPVVIEGPPPPSPPAELNFLHFDDKFSYWIFAAEGAARREANE
jgi:Carboxypeptidase regulatory-like domain/TIR domain